MHPCLISNHCTELLMKHMKYRLLVITPVQFTLPYFTIILAVCNMACNSFLLFFVCIAIILKYDSATNAYLVIMHCFIYYYLILDFASLVDIDWGDTESELRMRILSHWSIQHDVVKKNFFRLAQITCGTRLCFWRGYTEQNQPGALKKKCM